MDGFGYEYYYCTHFYPPGRNHNFSKTNLTHNTPLNQAFMFEDGGQYLVAQRKYEEIVNGDAAREIAMANYRLGLMYWDGRGVGKDHSKAAEYFQKVEVQLFVQQFPKSSDKFIKVCFESFNYISVYTKADEFEKLEPEQFPVAAYHLGLMHGKGLNGTADYLKAYQYLEIAYRHKIAGAAFELGAVAYKLGMSYLHETATLFELQQAYKYFEIAHQQKIVGVADQLAAAAYRIGKKYVNNREMSRAASWFDKAYAQGCRSYELGQWYRRPEKRDISKAIACFTACVNEKNSENKLPAAFELGMIYVERASGTGTPLDYAKALIYASSDKDKAWQYFTIACANGEGIGEAAYQLALIYPDNYQLQKMFFNQALAMLDRPDEEKKGVDGNEALVNKVKAQLKRLKAHPESKKLTSIN